MKKIEKNRKSPRWRRYDYGAAGMYFITICCKNKEHFFGTITNGVMLPSTIGRYAISSWLDTPALRSDMHIVLDEFVVMPNHFHALIVIGENRFNKNSDVINGTHDIHAKETFSPKNKFGPQAKNLAAIVRGFKASVSGYAGQMDIPFAWQARYHDHIVRDYGSYLKIASYIICNPDKWIDDCFYSAV